jgi:hypothetical protein
MFSSLDRIGDVVEMTERDAPESKYIHSSFPEVAHFLILPNWSSSSDLI